MSALSDVARLAEVSTATASRALSGRGYVAADTRDRVVAAAAEVGYLGYLGSAGSSFRSATPSIGLVVPGFTSWYVGGVLEGIEATLAASDYELTLHRLGAEPGARRRVLERLLGHRDVVAVIAVGLELGRDETSLLGALDRPVAAIGGRIMGIDTLAIDDRAAAAFVTGHLISLGHSRISLVGGEDLGASVDGAREAHGTHADRLVGFRQAMADAGLDASHIVNVSSISMADGHSAGLMMLADPQTRPTAIVAGTDELAIGVIVAARQLGIAVPERLSVIGIDGHDLAEMFSLTTLAQDPRSQGSTVARRILGDLSSSSNADAIWAPAPVRLDVRGSTRAPQA